MVMDLSEAKAWQWLVTFFEEVKLTLSNWH